MKRKIFLLILLTCNFFEILACFWDNDTLEMEKQQFPEVIELISGKFLRHSSEFHQWRINDREEKIANNPSQIALYDDLAVSYSKIENNAKAIEIILQKDKIKPGLYETYANLGTFHIHNGAYEKGIEFIDKAITVNPNAHFGREIYQRHVVEYILSKAKNGTTTLPISRDLYSIDVGLRHKPLHNFAEFLLKKYNSKIDSINKKRTLPQNETTKAIKGVKGMLKFGNYNSPVLLEVLGDLLISSEGRGRASAGARRLAGMCYLKASYEVENEMVKKRYLRKAESVVEHQNHFTLADLEKLLTKELKKGEKFYQKIRTNEINWISSNKDIELEFAKKYYRNSELPTIDTVSNDTEGVIETVTPLDTNGVIPVVKEDMVIKGNMEDKHSFHYLPIGLIILVSAIAIWLWRVKKLKK